LFKSIFLLSYPEAKIVTVSKESKFNENLPLSRDSYCSSPTKIFAFNGLLSSSLFTTPSNLILSSMGACMSILRSLSLTFIIATFIDLPLYKSSNLYEPGRR